MQCKRLNEREGRRRLSPSSSLLSHAQETPVGGIFLSVRIKVRRKGHGGREKERGQCGGNSLSLLKGRERERHEGIIFCRMQERRREKNSHHAEEFHTQDRMTKVCRSLSSERAYV